jgi:hypothetical protein
MLMVLSMLAASEFVSAEWRDGGASCSYLFGGHDSREDCEDMSLCRSWILCFTVLRQPTMVVLVCGRRMIVTIGIIVGVVPGLLINDELLRSPAILIPRIS